MIPSEDSEIKRRNNGKPCENIGERNSQPTSETKSSLTKYLTALRPWSFSASLIPVILGTVFGFQEAQTINVFTAILASISVLSVHGAGNLVNTYYDFLKGIDGDESDDKTLVNRILTKEEVVRFGVAIYSIGCASFLGTIILSPARIDQLALLFFAGVSGSFLYTGSIGFKYHALGDIVIFITFGPVSVLYAYIAQCGHLSFEPLAYAIPLVMNTEAILHGNNTRDIKCDKTAKVLTLAILLGFKLSYLLYLILIFVPYLIMLYLAAKLSAWFLLPILTIKFALALEKDFRFKNLTEIAQNTAKLNLLFGLLYVLAIFMK